MPSAFVQFLSKIRQFDEIFESGIEFSPQGSGIDFWQLVNSPQGKKLMPKNDFTEKKYFALQNSSLMSIQ